MAKNERDPVYRSAQQEIWAREKVRAAGRRKTPVYDYIPHIHNPEPILRPRSQDAFRCPSLVGKKRVPYWGYLQD